MKRSWRVQVARVLLGMALWLLCSIVIYHLFLSPPRLPPGAVFSVCVLDGAQAAVKRADARGGLPLCREALVYESDNGLYRIHFSRRGDEYYLRTFADSISDPWEFAYRLEGEKIVPLWWRYGTSLRKMMAVLYAAVAAVVLFRVLLWLMWRRRWRMAKWFDGI